MATTKANNSEHQKSLAQYGAIVAYAKEVFNHIISSDEYDMPMSAKEVHKYIFLRLFFDEKDGFKYEEPHVIEADGMKVCTTPKDVFALCQQMEGVLKIKPANRVKFMHEYTPETKDIFGVCTLPANTKEIAECCTKDELRPVMAGVYLDFDEKMVVASDGKILRTALLNDARIVHGEKLGAILPADFAARHAGEEVIVCGEYGKDDKGNEWSRLKYAYCGKERVKLIEGRYPNWKSVIPKYNNAQMITIGDAWTQMRDALKGLSKVCKSGGVCISGKTGERVLTLSAKNIDTGIEQSMQILIPAPIAFDFAICVNGEYAAKVGNITTMSVENAFYAIVWANGLVDDAKEIALTMPMLMDEDAPVKEWSTRERGEKYDKAKAKNEGKDVSTIESEGKPRYIEDTKPATPEASAPVEEAQPEPVCEQPTPEPVCEAPEEKKGAEALINDEWVKVEVLTTNGTRAMVKRENGQRAIVKLEDIRGNIVDNTADAPAPEAPSPEPVCETPAETPAPVETAPTPEALAEEIGTKYADEKVYIATYSEKSFILTGATKKYRKELKKYGTWYGKREGWILSNKRREFVEKLIGENLVSAAA